jgi:hypothetical protein
MTLRSNCLRREKDEGIEMSIGTFGYFQSSYGKCVLLL